MVRAYPGKTTVSNLRKQIDGSHSIPSDQAAADALEVSIMLNKMTGHHINLVQAQGAVIESGKKKYIYDLATLKSYLTEKYTAPVTGTSMAGISGKSGILMVETSDGSGGAVGLWDGSKMYATTDRNLQWNIVKKVYLWMSPSGGRCFMCFLILSLQFD